ncbi:hypothetical protein [Chlamydia sp. 17-3921]|uniref:hypothetical protein n=1 Tax=Chlamydia sp. 17-3921 TaxID=2675798 RepID=UPI00191B4DCB|nr:hypothetical protein [Chlamydia sp. 17-3921]
MSKIIEKKQFRSLYSLWSPLLEKIVASEELHAKWVNTLSFLENCGAKKIAASEHPIEVKKEVLKHAYEEFRHAHYMKSQISRITSKPFPNYEKASICGGLITKYYLHLLDLRMCKVLKNKYALSGQALKTTAYILVTFAIELRASELYPLYHDILKAFSSKVSVKSIILEEQGHLAEMVQELSTIPQGEELLEYACKFEAELCQQLVTSLENTLLTSVGI